MHAPPLDPDALETRRQRIVALFQARMARWQGVQGAAFAVSGLALAGFLGAQIPFPLFLTLVIVSVLAVVVSAGVQAGYEDELKARMDEVEVAFEKVKRGRSNL